MKNFIKEMVIFVLIIIALILIVAIFMYSYSPTGKLIPNKVSYQTPENIKEEISSSDIEKTTPVTITYELDETQINNSKKSGSYNSGKQNPFVKEATEITEDGDKTKDNSPSGDGKNTTSSEKNSSENKNETHYLPESGTK